MKFIPSFLSSKPVLFAAVAGLWVMAQSPARADATDDMWNRHFAQRAEDDRQRLLHSGSGSSSSNGGSSSFMPSNHYAAIAYSMSTRTWASSYDYGNLRGAQNRAVSECGAWDAKLVIWARNGWYCALAIGSDGSYGTGSGATEYQSKTHALAECAKRGANGKVVVCIRSN